MTAKQTIESGKAILGIEFGSTRIKAVLIDTDNNPIAQGSFEWENQLVDGLWTYSIDTIWKGLQDCYADLRKNVKAEYDCEIKQLAAIGISAMMHGYMAFGKDENILVPFRTWRNTNTAKAAAELSELFHFNIPLRWSISHVYQAILNGEDHINKIDFLTTLAGYIHWQLTGKKVLGVGDASGMLPIDSNTNNYDAEMVAKFDKLIEPKNLGWKILDILPEVLNAGEDAGALTEEGAKKLDPSGTLQAGVPLCPPEGDAGTGMVATNAVRQRTGNVSAGTSSFSMIVLEKALSQPYEVIDMVTTPDGSPVAMVHCNNCTNEINAWAGVFGEFLRSLGQDVSIDAVFTTMFNSALAGAADGGGLVAYNFITGEPVAGTSVGCPLYLRDPASRLTFANFMRTLLYSSLAALKMGNDILYAEHVRIDRISGHGGFFKTPGVGQRILAAAMHAPVSVMETAGEGGPWGMALLAAYMVRRECGQTLEDFLANTVFSGARCTTIAPDPSDEAGFEAFLSKYKAFLPLEHNAAAQFKG